VRKALMVDESNLYQNNLHYDTSINIIGGLKDSHVIYKAIESFFDEADSLDDLISVRNEFNLRTERSRSRVERAVKGNFLNFINQDHQDLVKSIFLGDIPSAEKNLILFWQYSLSNRLFFDISSHVFMRQYFSGRTQLSKDDIIAYLKEFLVQNKQLNLKWSESTINTLSTKYLNFMAKIDFLEGKRTKSFKHIKISAEFLVIFLYFSKLFDSNNNNILKNELLPLSFVSSEDLVDRLKKLSAKGFFNMNFNGVDLNIELTHSYKGICNVLYK